MNRTQKFSLNALSSAILQIVVMVVGFITPVLMIKTYGSEMNGLISSINQIISHLSLVEAGLSGAAVYSLYKPLAKKDAKGINGIVTAARNYYRRAGYIFSGGAFLMAVAYALLKATGSISAEMIFTLAILLSANGVVDFFVLARYRALLTADQKTYIISFISILQTVTKAVIIIVCTALDMGVIWIYVLALAPIAIKVTFLPWYCKQCYPYLSFSETPNEKAMGRRYDVLYQQILGVVQASAPGLIATLFLDWISVSIYSVYNMVLGGINGVLNVFISGLPAGFGEVLARGEREKLRQVVSQFEVAYYYILSVIYGLTLALFLPFIGIYTNGVTDADYYIPSLAVLIVLNGLVYNIKTPQSMLIISAGMYREMRWRASLQGAIIFLGGCLLVWPWGLQGIMVASIASNLYRTVDLLFFVPKHITRGKTGTSAIRMGKVLASVAVIAVPSLLYTPTLSGYGGWIIYAVIYGIYALLVTSLIWYVSDKKDFMCIIGRVRSLFVRR